MKAPRPATSGREGSDSPSPVGPQRRSLNHQALHRTMRGAVIVKSGKSPPAHAEIYGRTRMGSCLRRQAESRQSQSVVSCRLGTYDDAISDNPKVAHTPPSRATPWKQIFEKRFLSDKRVPSRKQIHPNWKGFPSRCQHATWKTIVRRSFGRKSSSLRTTVCRLALVPRYFVARWRLFRGSQKNMAAARSLYGCGFCILDQLLLEQIPCLGRPLQVFSGIPRNAVSLQPDGASVAALTQRH